MLLELFIEFFILCVFIAAVIVFILILCEADNHFNDLAKIRKWQKVSDIYEKQLSELKTKLDTLDINKSDIILLNHDTPYSSLIEAYVQVQNKLAEEASTIAKAEVRVEARKAGYLKFIVNIYGEN